MSFKRHARNASIIGTLITAGAAVMTVFCSKNDNGKNNADFDQNHFPEPKDGIGSWSLEARSSELILTLESCIQNHPIHCGYTIKKVGQSGSEYMLDGWAFTTECQPGYKMIASEKDPCDLSFIQKGRAEYYKFLNISCYDDSTPEKKPLFLINSIPERIECR